MIGSIYLQSSYSLLQSTLSLDELFVAAKKASYDAVFLADDTHLYGLFQFLKKAKTYQIKPIIGLKINLNFDETPIELLVYARNDEDLKRLIKLSSVLSLNSISFTIEDLKQELNDLVIVIPMIQQWIKSNYLNRDLVVKLVNELKQISKQVMFGISLQSDELKQISNHFVQYAKELNVLVLPAHKTNYLDQNDAKTFEVLRKIENQMTDVNLKEDLSFLHGKDLHNRYQSYPEVFKNLDKVFGQTQYHYLEQNFEMPKYPTPKNSSDKDYLNALATMGLKKRLEQNNIANQKPYQERLQMELNVINEMGYNDYFLIVYDFVKYARTNQILVGPGRGSAAGSLVAYCLGITEVDPIEYDLLFERFLNIERRTMPDIDLDFPDTKRDLVIEYVKNKYGKNHVVTITTFGSFAERSSIRDIARIMKFDQSRTNAIIKSVSLGKLDETDYEAQELITVAKKIEGLPRHTGTHAAGVILSKEDLSNWVPLQNGPHQILQSQLEASDLESLGFLKIDFLGLRNLTIIEDVLAAIEDNVKLSEIPLDDEKTYQTLQQVDVSGIFQLESQGMKRVLRELKPNQFEDVVALLALFRPGPMQFIDDYVRRRHGASYDLVDPSIDDILKATYGIIVYQEQIMKIAQHFAGYRLSEADLLRRGISKKDKDILDQEKERFISRAVSNGRNKELAEKIYSFIEKFADYGFNRSHSVAYALLAYQMAYLKTHYYQAFMTVLLSSVASSETLVSSYIEEIRAKGIKVLPPDIRYSKGQFIIIDGKIIAPLSLIKGIGYSTIDKIIIEREKEPFQSFMDFKTRMQGIINDKTVESLIHSGALDAFGMNHRTMFEKRELSSSGFELFLDDYKEQVFEEFEFDQLKQFEKDVFGFNIKYIHDNTLNDLMVKHQLKPISEKDTFIHTIVKIIKIKEVTTKKQELMAFLTLNDGTISISATLFPQDYRKYQELLKSEYIIIQAQKDVKGYIIKSIKKA